MVSRETSGTFGYRLSWAGLNHTPLTQDPAQCPDVVTLRSAGKTKHGSGLTLRAWTGSSDRGVVSSRTWLPVSGERAQPVAARPDGFRPPAYWEFLVAAAHLLTPHGRGTSRGHPPGRGMGNREEPVSSAAVWSALMTILSQPMWRGSGLATVPS